MIDYEITTKSSIYTQIKTNTKPFKGKIDAFTNRINFVQDKSILNSKTRRTIKIIQVSK